MSASLDPPLIPFFADSYVRAFLLNGFVMSAVAVITVAIRDSQRGDRAVLEQYMWVFGATFAAALSVYALFFVLFRYGGGLIATVQTTSSPVVRTEPSAVSDLFRVEPS